MLLQHRPVANGFIEHDVVLRNLAAQRGQHEGGIERAGNAFVGAGRRTLLRRRGSRTLPTRDAIGDAAAVFLVGARFNRLADLLQDDAAITLHADVGGKSPHREIGLQRIEVDLNPLDRGGLFCGLRHEWHIRVEQQAEIGAFEQGERIGTDKAGRVLRNIEIDGVELGNAHAADPRQAVERGNRVRLASEIGGKRDRIFRAHQRVRDGFHPRRLDATGLHAAIACRRIGWHCRLVPFLSERLARQHHVDRARRIAMGKGAGARERLLHHHA
jgi:hypothetical protein